LCFAPNVFRQANLDAFTNIVQRIRDRIYSFGKQAQKEQMVDPNNEEAMAATLPNCLELYGGVGTIGLHVIDLVSRLISSDENPYNQSCFQKSVKALPDEHLRRKVSYIPKKATDVVLINPKGGSNSSGKSRGHDRYHYNASPLYGNEIRNADVCIVDPPRKGLDTPVMDALLHGFEGGGGPKLLIYVSCGFPAFQRDVARLVENDPKEPTNRPWTLEHSEGFVLFPGSDALETLAFLVR